MALNWSCGLRPNKKESSARAWITSVGNNCPALVNRSRPSRGKSRQHEEVARGRTRNKIATQLEDLKADVEILLGDEQEAFDGLSEGLQMSSRGEPMAQAADDLDEAIDSLASALECIYSAIG